MIATGWRKDHSYMSSNIKINSDLDVEKGSFLGEDHKVIEFLGIGYYEYIYKCLNTITKKMEAVKIRRNSPDCNLVARREIHIMTLLQSLDPDSGNIIKYYGSFFHGEHICLRFELLDQSLADYIRQKHKRGLPMPELSPVIQQLAKALSLLSSLRIIHADIKPENVMIVDRLQTPLRVKLVDFGRSHLVSTVVLGGCVQDMWCKSPEALIGGFYNEAVDMWSLGVLAAELATGICLYPGYTGYEMLTLIIETQGQPSDKVLDRGRKTHVYFNWEGITSQGWRFKTPSEFRSNSDPGLKYEDKVSTEIKHKCLDDLQMLMCGDHKHQRDHRLLVDLIKRMLHLDQDQRIKPRDVLQHPFFAEDPPETSETITSMDVLQHPFFAEDPPGTSETITRMEMVDLRTEDIRESSSEQTALIQDIPCKTTATVSRAAEWKEDTGDVQAETKVPNGGGFFGNIFGTICNCAFCSR